MFLLLLLCREYARLGGVMLLISCVLFPLNMLTFYVLDRLEEYSAAYYEAELLTRPGFVHTGNPDIDSILNYKLGQAEAAGARLELDVKLPEGFTAEPILYPEE